MPSFPPAVEGQGSLEELSYCPDQVHQRQWHQELNEGMRTLGERAGRLLFYSLKMPERVTIRQESVEGERASFFAGTESRTRCETVRQWMEFTPERLGDISPARLPR
jgi:hypothetical protein